LIETGNVIETDNVIEMDNVIQMGSADKMHHIETKLARNGLSELRQRLLQTHMAGQDISSIQ
jgi:hypothetical protein